MRKILLIVLTFAVIVGCTGCVPAEQETVFAMDTVMDLQIWGKDASSAVKEIKALLRELEAQWSVTRPDSVLNGESSEGLNDEQMAVISEAVALSLLSDGNFDPCLRNVVDAWGFYTEQYRVPTDEELKLALEQQRLDLGGVIKGYAGRLAVKRLEELNIDRAILNLGGNVQTYGHKPDGSAWKIGIQNPQGGDPVGVVSVYGTTAVVTSGDYQRCFEQDGVRYHHIIDPETGRPADSGLASVTVICSDGMKADAFSTALFVMGLEEASEFWRQNEGFEVVFLLADGRIFATEGVDLSGCEFEVIRREK